jgi:hypothetical protein
VNQMGRENGCHRCGTKDFGTESGEPHVDHQPDAAHGSRRNCGAAAHLAPQKNNRNSIFLLTNRIEKHIILGMFEICVRALRAFPSKR